MPKVMCAFDIGSNGQIVVEIQNYRRFRARIALGVWLIKLGSRVIGYEFRVEEKTAP